MERLLDLLGKKSALRGMCERTEKEEKRKKLIRKDMERRSCLRIQRKKDNCRQQDKTKKNIKR